MDTKWKKIRNNTMLKVCTFLLACVFAFSTFYSLSYMALFSIKYKNTTDFSVFFEPLKDDGYTASKMFTRQFSNDAKIIKKMMAEYKNDENVRSGNAFKSKEAKLQEQMEKEIEKSIASQKKDIIENAIVEDSQGDLIFQFSDGQTVSQYTAEIDANASDEEILSVDGRQYYKGFPLDKIVIDEKEIRDRYEDEYKNTINRERIEYGVKYEEDKKTIEEFKNLKFAVLNKQTGEVFTNMNSEISEQTDFLSLAKGDIWNIAVQNGVLMGSEVNSYEEYYDYENGKNYSVLTSLSELFDGDGYCAYFEVNDNAKVMVEGDKYYDLYEEYQKSFADLKNMRLIAILSLVLMITFITLSAALAGKTDENGNTIKAKTDWIYNDIHFGVSAVIAFAFVALIFIGIESAFWPSYISSSYNDKFVLICCGASVGVAMAFFVEWLMSVVRHSRCKTYWKHTLLYSIFVKSGKSVSMRAKKSYGSLKDLLSAQHTKNLKTKMFTIVAQYAGANLVLALMYSVLSKTHHGFLTFVVLVLMLGLNLSLVLLAKGTIKALDDMMEVLIEAEKGKFDFNLDVYFMPRYLQGFATHIVNLRDGIKIAVDEAVKGERMKTELITNVSHDLKTPLTSIINYVDLLKRCELQDPTANSYVEILDEKSERLKRLIEDLVEASKISSGNVSLELTKVNLNELAVQLVGENEQELKELEIEIRVSTPSTAPIVKADSQKSYRAIENLFSNVRKYAMLKTRVYVDVFEQDDFGVISIKNISKNELDISVEQLTQRFVRGDEARTTEGNGLGLSIADNLIDLQNGEFKIDIDGDLFKATVKLPLDKDKS